MTTQPDHSQQSDADSDLPPSPIGPFFGAWWLSFAVIVLILLLNLLPAPWHDMLDLRGDQINQGEWWRILTSQFMHLTFNHTFLNITGFFIVTFSFRKDVPPHREAIALLVCSLGTGMGIWLFSPESQPYVGLSGAIYGLLACYAILGYRQTPFLSLFFILYMAGKFIYEHWFAPADRATEAFIGGLVATDSHLYGAASGLLLGMILFTWDWFCHDRNTTVRSSPV